MHASRHMMYPLPRRGTWFEPVTGSPDTLIMTPTMAVKVETKKEKKRNLRVLVVTHVDNIMSFLQFSSWL